jgi:hypothetical protein
MQCTGYEMNDVSTIPNGIECFVCQWVFNIQPRSGVVTTACFVVTTGFTRGYSH